MATTKAKSVLRPNDLCGCSSVPTERRGLGNPPGWTRQGQPVLSGHNKALPAPGEKNMELTIRISLENDAFGTDGVDRAQEVNRILGHLADRLSADCFEPEADPYDRSGSVKDFNGNTVGKWKVS